MPTFEIQAGDKTFQVDAPDQNTALAALQKMPAAAPEQRSAVGDFFKSMPRGVVSGFTNALSNLGQTAALDAQYSGVESASPEQMPTGAQGLAEVEKAVGPLPQPQGAAGRIGAAIGEGLGNPASYMGPGSLPLKVAGAVLSSGGSEAAAEAAKATGNGKYEGSARIAGALAGGMAAGKLATPSSRSAIPTIEELENSAARGYDTARKMGLEVKPSAVARTATDLQTELNKDGINAILAPKTFSILSDLQSPPKGAVAATVSDFETARRALGNAGKDFTNPTERLAASRAISHIDDYLANIPQSDVMAGDAAKVAAVLSDARGNYAAAKRASEVGDALTNAQFTAGAAKSGQNIANRTRQTLRPILTSEKKGRGFNEDELAQVERVVMGTTVGNSARKVANLLGAGGGLGNLAGIYTGATFGGPAGAVAAPAIGTAAKTIHNASVARQARILDEMLRSRSPLAQQTAAATPNYSQARAAAIARALLTAY